MAGILDVLAIENWVDSFICAMCWPKGPGGGLTCQRSSFILKSPNVGESSTLELFICTPPSIAAYQTRMTRDGEIANAGIPTKFGSVDEGRWTSCRKRVVEKSWLKHVQLLQRLFAEIMAR